MKPKIYSFLVDNMEHKKSKGVNKNVVAAISHNEYKDVLLNNKCNISIKKCYIKMLYLHFHKAYGPQT